MRKMAAHNVHVFNDTQDNFFLPDILCTTYSWLAEMSRNDIRLENDGIFWHMCDIAAAFLSLSKPELPILTLVTPCVVIDMFTSLISLIILVNIVWVIHWNQKRSNIILRTYLNMWKDKFSHAFNIWKYAPQDTLFSIRGIVWIWKAIILSIRQTKSLHTNIKDCTNTRKNKQTQTILKLAIQSDK